METNKIVLVVLVFLAVVLTALEVSAKPSKDSAKGNVACTADQEKGFEEHRGKHDKKFKDASHEKKKKENYCRMDNFIKEHNSKKDKKHEMEHNHLSDLSQEEMDEWNRAIPDQPTPTTRAKRATYLTRPVPAVTWTVPTSVNWTAKGVSDIVKDQGSCGSCYSFAATGAIEGIYKIQTGTGHNLSQENIIDCSSSGSIYGNSWCNGGMDIKAFKFIADKGLYSETAYPYTSQNPPAVGTLGYQWILNPWSSNSIDSFNVIGLNNAGNEVLLKQYVAKQPVSVSMYASMPDFQSYKSGVYSNPLCPKSSNNHAVLLVGYGTDSATGLDYWIVKNSWGGWPKCSTTKTCLNSACTSYSLTTRCGSYWGQGGYVKIQRGVNMCGIANYAAIPANT